MSRGSEKGKLFVGGLSWDTTKDSLSDYFGSYGEIIDCIVMENPTTKKSRGFGFVTYKDPACVDSVLSSGPHNLDGRQVDPKACNPKSAQQSRPRNDGMGFQRGEGGGGGGGRGDGRRDKSSKIFVGGLPSEADSDMLKMAFARYGKVTDVVIMYDQLKRRSRGFGFLTFENEESVDAVCKDHYVEVNNKQVECKRAEPRDEKSGGSGGGGGQWGPPGGHWNQNSGPPGGGHFGGPGGMGGGPGGMGGGPGGMGGGPGGMGGGPGGMGGGPGGMGGGPGGMGGGGGSGYQDFNQGGFNQYQGGYQQQGGWGQQPNQGGWMQNSMPQGPSQMGYGNQPPQGNYGSPPGGPQWSNSQQSQQAAPPQAPTASNYGYGAQTAPGGYGSPPAPQAPQQTAAQAPTQPSYGDYGHQAPPGQAMPPSGYSQSYGPPQSQTMIPPRQEPYAPPPGPGYGVTQPTPAAAPADPSAAQNTGYNYGSQYGTMGSYSQDQSSYGPTRGYTQPQTNGAAQTYNQAAYTAPQPAGGYTGADVSGYANTAGAPTNPTYGQPDVSGGAGSYGSPPQNRMPPAAGPAAGYHPYRRT